MDESQITDQHDVASEIAVQVNGNQQANGEQQRNEAN